MKFGGMSTPWGIFFYGDNYQSSIIKGKLKIKKNNNPGKHFIYSLVVVYLWIDAVINFGSYIRSFFSYIGSFIPKIPYISHVVSPISISFNYSIPWWFKDVALWAIIIIEYGFLVWFLYKTRGYHGAEHKAILAAQRGDVFKARNVTRITSHCGSNLLAPFVIIFALFSLFGLYLPGTSMGLALVLYQKVGFARRHLSRVGNKVQMLTTKEPTKKELKDAQRGISAIIRAEEARVYRRIKPFLNQIPTRT